jgi:myo-inositol-1(or 4)-monophosphatase
MNDHSRWARERAVALRAASAASEFLREAVDRPRGIRYKGAIDLVTDADIAAERIVLDEIRAAFPHDPIVSEEASSERVDASRYWAIDPLDGTTNFAHGYPVYAVSIALVDESRPSVGVVAVPALGEVFVAERGEGAWLGDRRLRVSVEANLARAFLVTGFPYDVRTTHGNLREWSAFVTRALAVRRDGAAAVDLAYVAAGRFDGFWESSLNAWDVLAGTLLVEEAGGRVSNYAGGQADPFGGEFLASNGRIHDAMMRVLAE